ncbi:MAG TPA: nucleotidyltransferase domain-containing protein [Candidatus Dormibacteraeota bacterium]|nr:nucleotidyltransferase domain-containing protein [Candidatus Dormibacteraeota bacterium]
MRALLARPAGASSSLGFGAAVMIVAMGVAPERQRTLLAEVKKAVQAIEPESRVVLYGSRARGDARLWSDWDVLVIVPGRVTADRWTAIRDRLTDLELDMDNDPVLSVLVVSRTEVEEGPPQLAVLRAALAEGIEV